MMQEVEVLKTIQELICSFFSEEQFTLSWGRYELSELKECGKILSWNSRVTGCVDLIPKEWG